MSTETSSAMVTLVYDFEKVGGATTTTSTPKKSSTVSFQQLMSRHIGADSVGDNAIYVGSQRSAYFRVDSPEMLDFILNYHAKREDVSTIVVRAASQNSPNTSPLRNGRLSSPSSGSPQAPSRRNVVDPFTLDNVDELLVSQAVTLADGKVQIKVDADSLVGFLQNAQRDGKSIFQVKLESSDQQGGSISIDFKTHELWFTCLCRGHAEASKFREIFMQGAKAVEMHDEALDDLRAHRPDLWHKMLFFGRDILRINEDGPGERVEAAQLDPNQAFFFSEVYFGKDLQRILDIPGPTGPTLHEILKHTFQKTDGGVVCSSHDLYPLISRFFGLQKNFWQEKGFKAKYKEFERTWKKNARR